MVLRIIMSLNLVNASHDIYDVNGNDQMDIADCGMMINDIYEQLGYKFEASEEDSKILLELLDKDKKGYVNQEDIRKISQLKFI